MGSMIIESPGVNGANPASVCTSGGKNVSQSASGTNSPNGTRWIFR
jgi:hypothetical protein